LDALGVSSTPHERVRGGPLAGIRILELSRVLAGPYLCRVLSDLGADVIKIEPPEGDQARQIAPKWDRGMSGMFVFANAGKRGLCIDLKAPGAVELVLELVGTVDAVVENFRPGVADRLGLGWSAIHAANPRAVMVSINGFGSDSTLRDRRAYAQIIHAASGVLHDQASYVDGPVQHIAQAYGDTTTALHGAVALLAGLREAEHSGQGRRIELAMYDSVLATYSETIHELRDPPGREDAGNTNGLYDAGAHGAIVVAGTPQHIWAELRGTYPQIEDPAPQGADIPTKARLRRRAMCAWMAAHETRDELVGRLERAGIACSPVESLRDALRGPFGRERELLVTLDDRRGGTREVVRSPYRFSGNEVEIDRSACAVRGSAPRRGEHNAEVLAELLDLSQERLDELVRHGVLTKAGDDEQ
jgi:crotonobetainyl-CoA:carnitine CoA-transferase CaiB-like acyl-CoA transferase